MKVTYDTEADALNIVFSETPVEVSDEDKPGIVLDYDKTGNIVSIEILDASKRMKEPQNVQHTVLMPQLKKAAF
ncbi:DUF2283 domain-containing protein [Bdellovibrionota bacterium FG-1]